MWHVCGTHSVYLPDVYYLHHVVHAPHARKIWETFNI